MDTTSTKQLIDVYKTILDQQSTTYSLLIWAFIGITALIVGSTWLWNFLYSKRMIQQEIQELLSKEMKDFSNKSEKLITESVDKTQKLLIKNIMGLKADSARMFALYCEPTDNYTGAVNWWSLALEDYIEMGESRLIRISTERLEENLNNPLWTDDIDSHDLNLDDIKERAQKIPDILTDERKNIINKIEEAQSKNNTS